MLNRVKHGDRVRVQYLGLLEDGTGTQKHSGRQVLDFTVGSKEVPVGISLGVVGMAVGEQRRLTLAPKDAYGEVRPKLIREIPRQRFPADLALSVGKRLNSVAPGTGRRRRVEIVALSTKSVVVDGNHPLAGKVLEVELQLVSLASSAGKSSEVQRDLGGEG